MSNRFLDRLAPVIFVLIWSTGWIVARAAAPFADPLTFLVWRFLIAAALLALFAGLARARWPQSLAETTHALIAGILLHAVYLGGVWWAIRHGLPASLSALIAALQPILTVALAPSLLGERLAARQKFGVGLGFIGLLAVLWPNLSGLEGQTAALPIAINGFGMLGLTLGSFYQKRFVHSGDLRAISALQYAGAAAVMLPLALASEAMTIDWTPAVVAAMAWSVLALSIGAIFLLLQLIRRGTVSRAAQLIYLVPPATALQAHLLFGENLRWPQIGGMALTVLGVALANRA
jgi:drug/metabolite transporter (DMT)-like permease